MPWQECCCMSLRLEFVRLASLEASNIADLCRRFGIARKTGYKWLARYRCHGHAGLTDQSRRPRCSPARTAPALEQQVIALRQRHPVWGGRKLHHRLKAMGVHAVPSPSTITAVLHRHGLIDPAESDKRRPPHRFERPRPGDLWQMDFKGDFALANGKRCHPLTVLDDHSRYSVALRACDNQRYTTVREQLAAVFEIHGLPRSILTDNGTPWGLCGRVHGNNLGLTRLTAWLMQLDIKPIHSRPFHPQTQGKEERFHRTLKYELLRNQIFVDCLDAQRAFDPWRAVYNHERPHEALGMATPSQRYRPSERPYPQTLPVPQYVTGDHVRRVSPVGQIHFQGRTYKTSEALGGHPLGLRPTDIDGLWAVYFARFHIADLDQRTGKVRRPRCQPPVAALPAADNAAIATDNGP